MITEEQKFRAETFRMLGIALLAPAGKILIDPLTFYQEQGLIYTVIYIVFSLVAAYVGLVHIEKARVILEEKRH